MQRPAIEDMGRTSLASGRRLVRGGAATARFLRRTGFGRGLMGLRSEVKLR
jgi:hypothetical protein